MKLTSRQDIETGILTALGFIAAGWYLESWLYVLIAAGVLVFALILPKLFRPVAYIWFGLGRILGYVVPYILLIIVFFLLVVPVGMIRKWLGKDGLQLGEFKQSSGSILKDRNHTYQPEDLKNPF